MLNKSAALLLFTFVPAAAVAQSVELRSTDGFISVEGEVVGFNGTMLVLETSVGRVSVPASEVGCYGAYCTSLLAGNSFGLTAANLQGVFSGEQQETVAETTVDPRQDDLIVTFGRPVFAQLYDTLAAAFAVGNNTASTVDLATSGVVKLEDSAEAAAAVLTVGQDDVPGDIEIVDVGLIGPADLRYPSSVDWALAVQPTYQMLGLDALAVIAPDNIPVEAISIEQLAGIYAGDITNWVELGGPDLRILPLQLPEGAQTHSALVRTVMEPFGKTIANTVLTMADAKSIAGSINQFPGSISVVGVGSLADNKTLAVSGACGLAVAPTPFNIISGDYPLLRPIMVNYGQPSDIPLVRDLFDFASAKVAQDLFARDGYVNTTAVAQDERQKNERLSTLLTAEVGEVERLASAQMFQDLFTAERLSPTMFGGPTSGPEGAWNRAMFHLLEDLLKTDVYAGREVLFVGYANSPASPEAAIEVSRQAAVVMRAAFTQFATESLLNNGLQVTSLGFGAIAPATCYGGQVTNNSYSRVEVWVR